MNPLWLSASRQFDRHLTRWIETERNRTPYMTTPTAITKLTEHAVRAKTLLADTDTTADKAGPILDNYEATLTRFKAGLSQVKENEKALAAVLQGMGNATEIIGTAFQDEKTVAAKSSVNGEQQPEHAVHPMPPASPSP